LELGLIYIRYFVFENFSEESPVWIFQVPSLEVGGLVAISGISCIIVGKWSLLVLLFRTDRSNLCERNEFANSKPIFQNLPLIGFICVGFILLGSSRLLFSKILSITFLLLSVFSENHLTLLLLKSSVINTYNEGLG